MRRFTTFGAVALALVVSGIFAPRPASAAHHEAVIQVVTVTVEPGKLEKYLKQVKKLNGVMDRLGSNGKMRVWNTTVGGPDTGTVLVGIEYPNSASWASDSAKATHDEEWRKIISGLDDIRTVESNSVWRDVSPSPGQPMAPGSGSVLAIIGVQVNPGKLDEYVKRVDQSRSINERLGANVNARIWHAEVAGPNTGAVVVGVEYSDLASYVAAQNKLAMDAEWEKFISGLGDIRSITGRWLYQEITP